MFEQPRKPGSLGWALGALALPMLLAHCGQTSEGGATSGAGAGGAAAPSGAGGALGGDSERGGSSANEGGAAGASAGGGGLGGDSAAGAAGAPTADAGAAGALLGAAGSAECDVELTSYTDPTAQHVTVCSAITYPMNPPVYGDHYPVWSAYKSYPYPIPLGFLVHNLEHGAIVLLYHCPDGCADEVAAAQAFIDALPADPRCTEEVKHQVVMSPDPSLPSRWAAVAWGHALAADCFAPQAVRTFYDANLGHGSEDLCADGADLAADPCQ